MKFIDFLTEFLTMAVAVLVGIGTTTLMFVSVSPDPWSATIMASLAVVLVLYSVRAIVKRRRAFWWLMASMIVFCDVSTFLTITEVKETAIVQTTDTTKTRLEAATDKAQGTLDNLLAQQQAANSKAHLDSLATQIERAQKALDSAKAEERAYRPSHETRGFDPTRLFMAIPNAVVSLRLDRIMTLIFALIIACALQAGILSATNATLKNVKRNERDQTRAAAKGKGRSRAKRAAAVRPEQPTEPVDMPSGPGIDGIMETATT